ncbi:unnamed protein product [Rhodiola kirilowii]
MREASWLIQTADVRLRVRDFAGCRTRALEAMQLDPFIFGAEHMIAICDVFLALESSGLEPVASPNWYSILKLEPFTEDDDLIAEQFKNLITLLSPSRNMRSHALEAYKYVREAFRVLSCEEKKKKFDEELRKKSSKGVEKETKGFWTMCPYCYWMYEYEMVYLNCCLRCQNCRRGFHAVMIQLPPQGLGGEIFKKHLALIGFMPFGVVDIDMKAAKKDEGCKNGTGVDCVEISDDDVEIDDELKRKESGNSAGVSEFKPGGGVAGTAPGSGSVAMSNGRGRGGRRKTVASNTKKVMGRGIPRSMLGQFPGWVDRKTADAGEGSSAGGGNVATSSGAAAGSVDFMDEDDDDLMVCLEDL